MGKRHGKWEDPKMHLTRALWWEINFEVKMAENIPKLLKDANPQIKQDQRIPRRVNRNAHLDISQWGCAIQRFILKQNAKQKTS